MAVNLDRTPAPTAALVAVSLVGGVVALAGSLLGAPAGVVAGGLAAVVVGALGAAATAVATARRHGTSAGRTLWAAVKAVLGWLVAFLP